MASTSFSVKIKDTQVFDFSTYYLNEKTFEYHTTIIDASQRIHMQGNNMQVYATLPVNTIVRPIVITLDGQRWIEPSRRLTREIDGSFTITGNYYEHIFPEPIGDCIGFQYWPRDVA